MSRGKWLGRWFKVFDNFDDPKFWTSKIDNDELGAWLRLLAIASKSTPKGSIQPLPGLKMTDEQTNGLIKTEKDYLKKWEKQGSIKTENGIIYIANWGIYQNEQDRKDRYKDTLNRPPKKTPKKTHKDRDVDVYLDLDVEQKQIPCESPKKDSRIKVLIDYFFIKHLEVKKSKIAINGGKDGDIFKDLLTTFTLDEIKAKIDMFMAYNDPWMHDKPYSIGMFKSQFNKLKEKPSGTIFNKEAFL